MAKELAPEKVAFLGDRHVYEWFTKRLYEVRNILTPEGGTCSILKEITSRDDTSDRGDKAGERYLRLDPADFCGDVSSFRECVNDGKRPTEAIDIYEASGQLLADFRESDDPWLTACRTRLRKDYVLQLLKVAGQCLKANSFPEALERAKKAYDNDDAPSRPRPTWYLLAILHKMGRINECHETYEAFKDACSKHEIKKPSSEVVEAAINFKLENAEKPGAGIPPPGVQPNTPALASLDDQIADALVAKGRQLLNHRTEVNLRAGIREFDHALQHSAGHPGASAGKADAHSLLSYYSFVPPGVAYREACRSLAEARHSVPEASEVLTARAWIAMIYEWDWEKAETLFQQALKIDGNSPTARQWYSFRQMLQGENDMSRIDIESAYYDTPQGKTAVISKSIGQRYHYAGRFTEAVAQFKVSLDKFPNECLTLLMLGQSYEQIALEARAKGDEETAQVNFGMAVETFNASFRDDHINYPSLMAALGHAYGKWAKSGNPKEEGKEARAVYKQLLAWRAKGNYVSPVALATIHLGLGETEQALKQLEQAALEKPAPGDILLIGIDPRFKPLALEPRFSDVLKTIGLPLAGASEQARYGMSLATPNGHAPGEDTPAGPPDVRRDEL